MPLRTAKVRWLLSQRRRQRNIWLLVAQKGEGRGAAAELSPQRHLGLICCVQRRNLGVELYTRAGGVGSGTQEHICASPCHLTFYIYFC